MTAIVDKPGTVGAHALVVGVGEYPWLDGGSQPRFQHFEGMGQLSSPPQSARAFADWVLRDFGGAAQPLHTLASLEVLLSDPASTDYVAPDGVVHPVERATSQAIEDAVLRWYARGDADANNLLLFYYCGHGIARGLKTTLLPEDYGSKQQPASASLPLAIDFDELYLGMDQCKARQQLYFIDACRVASGVLMKSHLVTGKAVIPGLAAPTAPPRNAPVYNGAVPGTQAFGRVGKASFFTDALLKAFRGAAADDSSGRWVLQTDRIQSGVHYHLRRAVASSAAQGQFASATNLGPPFEIHPLDAPAEIPVEVTCDPSAHNPQAQLTVKDNAGAVLMARNPAAAQPWEIELPVGDFEFEAAVNGAAVAAVSSKQPVRPPFRTVRIQVP
jgi:hypothetical protein